MITPEIEPELLQQKAPATRGVSQMEAGAPNVRAVGGDCTARALSDDPIWRSRSET